MSMTTNINKPLMIIYIFAQQFIGVCVNTTRFLSERIEQTFFIHFFKFLSFFYF